MYRDQVSFRGPRNQHFQLVLCCLTVIILQESLDLFSLFLGLALGHADQILQVGFHISHVPTF